MTGDRYLIICLGIINFGLIIKDIINTSDIRKLKVITVYHARVLGLFKK